MEVVDTGGMVAQRLWAPIDEGDTFYTGQLVNQDSGQRMGVQNAGVGGAAIDNTHSLLGIIEAVDTSRPTFNTTLQANQVAGVTSQADQVARTLGYSSDRGVYIHGDPAPYVKVALITPWTKVKIPIYNVSWNAAITVCTVTSVANDDGTDFTSNVTQFTPIANEHVAYCRTGANAGIMRTGTDTSTATFETTNILPFPYSIAVGDTFVRVPYRAIGESFVTLETESRFANAFVTSTSNTYYIVNVQQLVLDVAGAEHMIGTFSALHFD